MFLFGTDIQGARNAAGMQALVGGLPKGVQLSVGSELLLM